IASDRKRDGHAPALTPADPQQPCPRSGNRRVGGSEAEKSDRRKRVGELRSLLAPLARGLPTLPRRLWLRRGVDPARDFPLSVRLPAPDFEAAEGDVLSRAGLFPGVAH